MIGTIQDFVIGTSKGQLWPPQERKKHSETAIKAAALQETQCAFANLQGVANKNEDIPRWKDGTLPACQLKKLQVEIPLLLTSVIKPTTRSSKNYRQFNQFGGTGNASENVFAKWLSVSSPETQRLQTKKEGHISLVVTPSGGWLAWQIPSKVGGARRWNEVEKKVDLLKAREYN